MSKWLRSRFQGFRLKRFSAYFTAALIYPVYALTTSENGLLKCIDALTVTGLVFLILAVVYSLVAHGDFDISAYVTRRGLKKGKVESFDAYKEDQKEKRKNSVNYPFFTGALLLLAAALLTAFVY